MAPFSYYKKKNNLYETNREELNDHNRSYVCFLYI